MNPTTDWGKALDDYGSKIFTILTDYVKKRISKEDRDVLLADQDMKLLRLIASEITKAKREERERVTAFLQKLEEDYKEQARQAGWGDVAHTFTAKALVLGEAAEKLVSLEEDKETT